MVPRLRMFAGPNGSGKSALKKHLAPDLLGVYLNPDDLEAQVKKEGVLRFSRFGMDTLASEAIETIRHSRLMIERGLLEAASTIKAKDSELRFPLGVMNSYFASVLSDFLRQKLLKQQMTFTFETVMSHESKVCFLNTAQQAGYRTYLYYVATEDPAINVSRVANRVGLGGHAVPKSKIVERYYRSLDLLLKAIQFSNRAYIFDNSRDTSDHDQNWVAEITNGAILEIKTNRIPRWFQSHVLDRLEDSGNT